MAIRMPGDVPSPLDRYAADVRAILAPLTAALGLPPGATFPETVERALVALDGHVFEGQIREGSEGRVTIGQRERDGWHFVRDEGEPFADKEIRVRWPRAVAWKPEA